MSDSAPVEILLVEDNEDDIVLISDVLSQEKLLNVVQVVNDGAEAMKYLRGEAPHADRRLPGLVLLDINMPKMDGLQVLEAIKTDPAIKHIPIVMLTTSTNEEDIVRSYSGGACSYIAKPVDFHKLQEVLRGFELYWTLVSRLPNARA